MVIHKARTHKNDNIASNIDKKERAIVSFIKETFPHAYWEDQAFFGWGCWSAEPGAGHRAFVDLYGQHCFSGTNFGHIMIEVDENCHRHYRCEEQRMHNIINALAVQGNTMPVLFVRYNPDRYMVDGVRGNKSREERMRSLEQQLKDVVLDDIHAGCVGVLYMFYDAVLCTEERAHEVGRPDLAGQLIPECLTKGSAACALALRWFWKIVI
jgi:hypothetical protein